LDSVVSCQFRNHLLRVLLTQIKLLAQKGCQMMLATRAARREAPAKVCV
jgi:hypothetical protein